MQKSNSHTLAGKFINNTAQIRKRTGETVNRRHDELVTVAHIRHTLDKPRAGSLGAAGNLILKEPVNPAGSIEQFFLTLIILLHRRDTDIAHPLPMRTRVIAH